MKQCKHWRPATALHVFCALSLPPAVAAAQPEGTGFEAGMRTGYGVPFGKASDAADDDLDESIAGQIPLWFDVGYRVTPNVFVGAFGTVGFGFEGNGLEDLCDQADLDCSVFDFRLGAQLHYHIAPTSSPDPWLGIGFGYEWLKASFGDQTTEVDVTIRGFEFLNLQGGLDFQPVEHLLLGPFIAFSLGRFTDASMDCSGPGCTGQETADIDDTALHEWLFIGFRIAYGP